MVLQPNGRLFRERGLSGMIEIKKEPNTYLAAFDSFEKNVAGWNPGWLREARRDALARFADLGFPTTREEAWRHTECSSDRRGAFPAGASGYERCFRGHAWRLPVRRRRMFQSGFRQWLVFPGTLHSRRTAQERAGREPGCRFARRAREAQGALCTPRPAARRMHLPP